MATLLRRTASAIVGSFIKNLFPINPFLDKSRASHGRLLYPTPSVACNSSFTTSARKRASLNDPLLRVIESKIGFTEQADDYKSTTEVLDGKRRKAFHGYIEIREINSEHDQLLARVYDQPR